MSGKEQVSPRDETTDMSNKCLPCREGCPFCQDDTPCLVQEDGALRLVVASFQGLCMMLDLASMVVVYHFRRNKVRRVGVNECWVKRMSRPLFKPSIHHLPFTHWSLCRVTETRSICIQVKGRGQFSSIQFSLGGSKRELGSA